MAKYTYVVQDLVSGTILDELPLRSVEYGQVLNGPGGFSGSIDRRHPKATRANLAPSRTALYVLRENVCVWGGIIWTVRSNYDGLGIGAEGFWSYFRRRRLRKTFNWTPTGDGAADPLYMVRTFINYAQSATESPGGNIGVTVGSELIGSTVERAWYGYERKRIGDVVEALTDNQLTFDFAIDCSYDATSNTFTKTLNLDAPRRGTRTNITWEIGRHCELSEYLLDGTKQENMVHGIGAGEGDSMLLGLAADTSQLGAYPLLEGAFIAKDISQAPHMAELCNTRLERRKYPTALPNIYLYEREGTEIGSFTTGDDIRLTGGDGFTTYDRYFRIDSWTCRVDDQGGERTRVEFVEAALDDELESAT